VPFLERTTDHTIMSDTWRAIEEDDFWSALSEPEDSAYRERMLVAGQTDPLVQIIAHVTRQFRNAIRSFSGNTLHEDQSFVPEGAIFHAVAMIRYRILGRFAVSSEDKASEIRRDEYKEAIDWLKLVRKGDERIEPPAGTGTETGGSEIEVLSNNDREMTRKTLKGLY
jgi:hypothetical protein